MSMLPWYPRPGITGSAAVPYADGRSIDAAHSPSAAPRTLPHGDRDRRAPGGPRLASGLAWASRIRRVSSAIAVAPQIRARPSQNRGPLRMGTRGKAQCPGGQSHAGTSGRPQARRPCREIAMPGGSGAGLGGPAPARQRLPCGLAGNTGECAFITAVRPGRPRPVLACMCMHAAYTCTYLYQARAQSTAARGA